MVDGKSVKSDSYVYTKKDELSPSNDSMKLSLKLALYIAAFALVSACVAATLSYERLRFSVEAKVSSSMESITNTMLSAASKAAYAKDYRLATSIVASLELNPEIQCVEMSVRDMPKLIQKNCIGEFALSRALTLPDRTDESLGTLRLFENKDYLKAAVSERFADQFPAMLMMIVMMSASLYILIYVTIARPVVQIARQLENSNFDDDVQLLPEGTRNDEVGDISRVINLMGAKAKKQIISERMLTLKTQELSSHFRLIFQLSKNNLAVTDEKLNLKSFNATFEEMVTSAQPDKALQKNADWLASVTDDPDTLRQLVLNEDEFDSPVTIDLQSSPCADGKDKRFYTLTFVKSVSESEEVTVLFFIYDMTEHRNRLAKTEYQASHDNLTKLLNRRAATKKIRYLLSAREDAETVAVMFIDLDGFKQVNDKLGHEAGDFVLKNVGARLKDTMRKTDLVCRWGGDEFLVALNNVSLPEATKLADKLLACLVEPIRLPNGSVCEVGASIGVALSSSTICDFQTLYDQADKAMYRVKKSGKNAVFVQSVSEVDCVSTVM